MSNGLMNHLVHGGFQPAASKVHRPEECSHKSNERWELGIEHWESNDRQINDWQIERSFNSQCAKPNSHCSCQKGLFFPTKFAKTGEFRMPEKRTIERVRKAKREGKSPSTQAGEFVHEEIEHVRKGKHGARSAKQAIAIGLSKARRAGVKLSPPRKGKTSAATRRKAAADYKRGQSAGSRKASPTRSRASAAALKREGRSAVSRAALSRQAKQSARKRK
jgi:hypothetical protein